MAYMSILRCFCCRCYVGRTRQISVECRQRECTALHRLCQRTCKGLSLGSQTCQVFSRMASGTYSSRCSAAICAQEDCTVGPDAGVRAAGRGAEIRSGPSSLLHNTVSQRQCTGIRDRLLVAVSCMGRHNCAAVRPWPRCAGA